MGADGLLRSLGAKLVVIIMRLWVKREYYWCPAIDSICVGLCVWENEESLFTESVGGDAERLISMGTLSGRKVLHSKITFI